MALIKCPECGKQISNQADACPNCGYPIKSTVTKTVPTMLKFTSPAHDARYAIVYDAITGKELLKIDRETARSINITKSTKIAFEVMFTLVKSAEPFYYVIQPGKCYELKYYKKTLLTWGLGISEVSAIM